MLLELLTTKTWQTDRQTDGRFIWLQEWSSIHQVSTVIQWSGCAYDTSTPSPDDKARTRYQSTSSTEYNAAADQVMNQIWAKWRAASEYWGPADCDLGEVNQRCMRLIDSLLEARQATSRSRVGTSCSSHRSTHFTLGPTYLLLNILVVLWIRLPRSYGR